MAPIDSPRHSDIWLRSGKQSPQHQHHRKNGMDPCKVLEPKLKTMESLEAERIMTVFQDALKRMQIVTILPHVLEVLPRYSVILGQELMAQMETHLRLQDSFKDLTSELNPLLEQQKDGSMKTKMINSEVEQSRRDTVIHQAAIIAQVIKKSLRNILRYFKKNPKSIDAILSSNLKRNVENSLLMKSMTSLMTIITERLLTTPFEQQEKMSYLLDVIRREKKTHSTKEKLEVQYNEAVKAKEAEIAERDAIIVELQNKLQLLQKINLDQQQKTLTEALKQTSVDTKLSKAQIAKYHEDILGCRKTIKEHRSNHRENEIYLRKRTFKMATEVYNWVQKYDADLETRQDEFDLYTRMYEADKADLAQLQSRFEVLEKQYNAIMEERRLMEEETARKAKEEQQNTNAATIIQAAWRAYQFRKAVAKKAKKDKKTGKKGKDNK
ncbi:dynein regulatory complex protein 10-like [Montipora capricornis]|uniref:dynein regulatory complex protein 10-like n=1 Tax=Montipora capricornis TaxID=246305 RepID=UPI0035F12C06